MAVEISGITMPPSDDLITAASLDHPRTGPVDGYAFQIFGWVVSKAPVAEVEFVYGGRLVACCKLNVSRPDVAAVHGGSSQVGFWKAIGTVGLPSDFTIGVRVVFQDGRRREIAQIRGTQRLTSALTPSMQPIIVTSPGRSGSTLLIRMLAEHPDIIVHERFPYGETYICSYWMHFLNVLAAPGDTSRVGSLHFWTDPKQLLPFPYVFLNPDLDAGSLGASADRWYANNHVEEFARVAQAAVESFYREYARGRKRSTPAFFAEKNPPADHIRSIMWQLYPQTREIFLFRDPRDTLVSVLAHHAKNGFNDYAGQLVETDEQLVGLIRNSLLDLTRLWKSRSQYGALVRYEDLIRSPTKQIPAMLDALELDSSADIVDAMVKAGNEVNANVNSHKTSSDTQSSIGRWMRELDPRLQKICDEAFDGLLDELGGSSQ
jgi:hypothetical protein